MVDDDELVRADWLTALVACLARDGADAAGGPVLWDLPVAAPAWQHYLPTSPRYSEMTGKARGPMSLPSTNNALISRRIVNDLGIRFDTRFGLATGEDPDFFRQAQAKGARFAYVDAVLVTEQVPASRLTLAWRFRRWQNFAGANVIDHRLQHGAASAWAHFFPRALSYCLSGPVLLIAAPIAGPKTMLKGVKQTASGIGMLHTLFGGRASEYEVVHGE